MSAGPGTSTAQDTASAPVQAGRATVLIYTEFFLTGIFTTFLGPMLPALSQQMGILQADAGTVFVAQFSGSAIGAIFSNLNLRRSLFLGMLAIAAGVGTTGMGNLATTHFSIFLYGVGLGLVIPATNMLVAKGPSEGRGARLNLLNLVWGAGAVASPFLIAAALQWVGLSMMLLTLGIGSAILLVLLGKTGLPLPQAMAAERLKEPETRAILSFFLLCIMLFLYVGIENAIGGWIAALMHDLGKANNASSALVVFCFWGALLGGRALSPAILKCMKERTLHYLGLLVAASGAGIVMTAGSWIGVCGGSVIAGLGLAPVFALIISLLAGEENRSGRRAGGWVFALGGMGGAALPWLSGRVARANGSIQSGYAVPIVAITIFLFILFAFHRLYAGATGENAPAAAISGQSPR